MCSRGEVTTHEDGRLPGPVDCMQLKSSTPTRMAALPGFSALVAAEAFGLTRNMAVATKGDVFVTLQGTKVARVWQPVTGTETATSTLSPPARKFVGQCIGNI